MSAPIEVLVAVFPDRPRAQGSLDAVKQLAHSGAVKLVDGALVTKDPSGKVKVDETTELTPGKGTARGAIVGGVLGLIFPPSLLVSAALGGGIGALIGKLRDTGIKTDDLRQVAADPQPGETAMVAVVEDRWIEQVAAAVQGYDRVYRQALDARAAAVLAADPATGSVAAAGFEADAGGAETAGQAGSATDVGEAAKPTGGQQAGPTAAESSPATADDKSSPTPPA